MRRKMEAIRDELDEQFESEAFKRGALWGLRYAMKALYPDAESFVGEDPKANDLVLMYLAVEEK